MLEGGNFSQIVNTQKKNIFLKNSEGEVNKCVVGMKQYNPK